MRLPKRPVSGDRPVSIENWIYKTLNPVMTALLRSPLHGIASGSIALLHFRGRKSGREFVTPLSYTRENDTVPYSGRGSAVVHRRIGIRLASACVVWIPPSRGTR
jgi:hypothetical protein